DLILSLAPDPRERWLLQKQLETTAILLSEGILIKEFPYHRTQICSLELSDELLIKLGCETNKDAKALAKKMSSYFEMTNPPQKLADLIIPEGDKKLLSTIANKCHKGNSAELQKWGFNPDKTTSKKGLIVLLYGAPGTGKTFAAGALANELKRDLIKLNVPELRNKYYGETEKLLKKAFGEMRQMADQNPNPPIFLLNEADQLVHNRISSNSTCGAIENTIQSIILEEMETFPGILILTTNLESNMDDAFFRRFDLKMKFNLPDLECRRKLWKLYLKKEIPGARAIDIQMLSQRYRFSGSQIALVVQNACVEAINRKGSDKRLLLTDLSKYADLEKPWIKGLSKSIGF
ncbi:MAG: AAA family ATPase, partial [Candidatus Cloacimonetes bacterium]|nr:AAA family ATPase [Candidatus Cloacimonadota bacterium]